MSPRPAKSMAAHQLQGTTPCVPEGEVVAPGRPRYPKGITGAARTAFKRLTKMLEQRRHVTHGDEEILRLYAVLFDRHSRALLKVAEEGEVRVYWRLDNHGEKVPSEKPNLWLKVAEVCESKMLACLSALGLTPSARKNVKATEEPKQTAADPFEELLQKRASASDLSKGDVVEIDERLLQ